MADVRQFVFGRILAKVTIESFDRIRGLQRRVQEAMLRVAGSPDYEAFMNQVRQAFRTFGLPFATWSHDEARRIYPTDQPDTIPLDKFDDVLSEIDTQAKHDAALAALPEEAVPAIEKFYRFVLYDLLPRQRDNALALAKNLPHRPSSGKRKVISDDDCRELCKQINELIAQGVTPGVAQARIAKRHNYKERTLQRCWSKRSTLIGLGPGPSEK